MAARKTTFEGLYERGEDVGFLSGRQSESIDWYRSEAQKLRVQPRQIMREDLSKLTPRLRGFRTLGNMYMFHYKPKGIDTLDYYDQFPLVFPIEMYNDGFLGINMHYLSPLLRARLMDAFDGLLNNQRFDDTTRLLPGRANYEVLSGIAKYKYFRPCLKRYLNERVVSRFMKIDPSDWNIALFLPIDRFKGAKRQQVWIDSKDTIRKTSI
tara:strand:+ start:65 stop:694 length:630 start_codon:yes stop_codon:yes gene_type:complete